MARKRRPPEPADADEADVLFLVDNYDAETLLQMARRQQQYVGGLTATADKKLDMSPDVDASWGPANDDYHEDVAVSLAVTNQHFTAMTEDAVRACTSRPRLEIEARKMSIVTTEMQTGLKRIKQAILGEEAQQGNALCPQGTGMEEVVKLQRENAETLQKLIAQHTIRSVFLLPIAFATLVVH